MSAYYYEYQKSLIVEDEIDIPDSVVAKGDKAIRMFIMETVWNEEYNRDCASEDEQVTFGVVEVPA